MQWTLLDARGLSGQGGLARCAQPHRRATPSREQLPMMPTQKVSSLPDTSALVCPSCRQALQRRPRHFMDRVLALLTYRATPLRRYACTDKACGWQGLLRGHLPGRAGYVPKDWL